MRICLATVITKDFLPGGLVLFQSFLESNPWFAGDLVVIHDGLERLDLAKFEAFAADVEFLPVAQTTQEKLTELSADLPGLGNRLARFYSIEVFRLANYDRVMFCDCDMLFLDSVEKLFQQDAPLLASPDGPVLRGNGRDPITFEELSGKPDGCLSMTFNAGLLLFDKSFLSSDTHAKLQSYLCKEFMGSISSGHTDQVLYNILFDGQVTYIDAQYNFLMMHIFNQLPELSGSYQTAKVLHFNGHMKPWLPEKSKLAYKMHNEVHDAFKRWNQSYLAYLQQAKMIGRD